MSVPGEQLQPLGRLPHGPEFRFLDRVTFLDPGKCGTAEYHVRGEEPFLKGHFPGDPLMPGVLLLEAAAQLAGVIAQTDPSQPPLAGLKLTAIRAAKIFGSARPGETLVIKAAISARMGKLVQADATVEVNGAVVLQGAVTLSGD